MKPLATLNALHHGTGPMSLELIQQSVDELSLARMPYAEVRVHAEILDALAARIRLLVEAMGEARAAKGPTSKVTRTDPLIASCQGLFNEILPIRQQEIRFIRDPLCDLKTALLIATNVPEVPWELLHNGTDFLGLRYEMGRSLRARGPEWRPGQRDGNWQCLIIANPTEDLPTAAVEAAAVKESLEGKGIACDYLAGKDASFENVLHHLNSGHYDIIHYSGHIGREEESREFGFLLNNSRFFTASSIRTHVHTPAIAFLNGCNSGAVVQGLTEAFLSTGAQMVVGSLFNTPSRGAAAFAKRFYSDFLRGMPAGEAMRQARLHVKDMENCGHSWACFVMYGDPRFSLSVQSDELDTWLGKAGFERTEFDAGAIKILRQAVAYGAVAGGVSTAILFAALLEGEDPFLRHKLEACGVLELLEGAFSAALKSGQSETSGVGRSEPNGENQVDNDPSPNVVNILRRAKEVCLSRGLTATTELGLVSGFALEEVGGAWKILDSLNVKPSDLDPWGRAPALRTIAGVGVLNPENCVDRVCEILLHAVAKATRIGLKGVSAIPLFQAMTTRPGALLTAKLQWLGVVISSSSNPNADQFDLPVYEAAGKPVPCSDNVSDILARALASAEARGGKVEENDLVCAFAENGGGAAGEWLIERGLPPRLLVSRLFLEGGALDTGRFNEDGQKVIDEAFDVANTLKNGVIGRRHLLYGLLSASECVAGEIRKQNCDAEMLAEALYVRLNDGAKGTAPAVPRWSSFSTSLLKVLCEAEAIADSEGADAIGDEHLFQAWCMDSGGASREFLIQNGIRVRKLGKQGSTSTRSRERPGS